MKKLGYEKVIVFISLVILSTFFVPRDKANAEAGCVSNGILYPVGTEIVVGDIKLRCTTSGWQEI